MVVRRRTVLATVAAGLGGAGLLTGMGSFSSAEAEREVTIEVADDEDAFLRLVYPPDSIDYPQSIDCEDTIDLVTIENQTTTDLDSVTVTVEDISDKFELQDNQGEIKIGDLETGASEDVEVSVTVESGFEGTGEVRFSVSASGPETEIETDDSRSVTIDATCSNSENNNETNSTSSNDT